MFSTKKIKDYGSFIKIEHTLFSLPMVLSGVVLAARGLPDLDLLFLILIGASGVRAAALGLNRFIDREIDRRNPRTRSRELPLGRLSNNEALFVIAFGLLLYLVSAYLICPLVFYLSPIPLIVFVIYPYMKRFTKFCHMGVGLALAMAPLGGWIAVKCSFEGDVLPVLFLSLFTLFWVSGFDIIYATLDEEFDRREGIFSLVAAYGKRKALRIASFLHVLSFVCLFSIYVLYFRNTLSALFLLVVAFLLYLEHRKSSDVDLAFFRINIVVGFIVFLFILSGIYS